MVNNIKEAFNTKSKEFENTVSIVTTGAAAGIAVAKAINKSEKVGAIIGIGAGLLIYTLFNPKEKLKKETDKLDQKIKELEAKYEK
jgi:uncharacterized membrane protein YgaE (UPF0421/DUF939 family)